MFNNSKDKFMESILQGKIKPFHQFAIGIEYGMGVPKLIMDKDTKSMIDILNYEFKLYTNGKLYAYSKITNNKNSVVIGVCNDFINLFITIRNRIKRYITENMLNFIDDERKDYGEIKKKITHDYITCCRLLVFESMIKEAAIKDKRLYNYIKPNTLDVINTIINDNKTYLVNTIKQNNGEYVLNSYNEVRNGISYIVLMFFGESSSKHFIIEVNNQYTKKDYAHQIKNFVSKLKISDKLADSSLKIFITFINKILKCNEEFPNLTQTSSDNVSVMLDRKNKSIHLNEIVGIISTYSFGEEVSNFVDFIGHLFEVLPLVTTLELFVATEAIREGRRILDSHLGIGETSTLLA